jgi:hypothetical protein
MKSDTRLVRVSADDPVDLRVIIGQGQPGGTTVLWDGKILALPEDRESGRRLADRGRDVYYQVFTCTTFIKDLSDLHNRTSVEYVITSDHDERFPYALDAPNDKDWVQYVITFALVPAD